MTTTPTIPILTLAEAEKAGIKQSVSYAAPWPRDHAELERLLADFDHSGIAAAIVIVEGTKEKGRAEVRRTPVPPQRRTIYQQIRAVAGTPYVDRHRQTTRA